MIQVNELRIGNWVMEAGEPSQIYMLDRGGITNCRINDIVIHKKLVDERFKPIPLSEDLVLLSGFEKRSQSEAGIIYGKENKTLLYGRTTDNDYGFFLNGYHNDVHLQHLHQLQNLFFALTEKELEIKF